MAKSKRDRFRRHCYHWNMLRLLGQSRYQRALRLWRVLFHVRPCGLVCHDPSGKVGLNFVPE